MFSELLKLGSRIVLPEPKEAESSEPDYDAADGKIEAPRIPKFNTVVNISVVLAATSFGVSLLKQFFDAGLPGVW